MKEELQQQLYNKFPDLFQRHEPPLSESNMHSDLVIGDGWYDILYVLCEEIQDIIQKRKLDPRLHCFGQVKEKLGLLRVYMNQCLHDEEISYTIHRAVKRSAETCENCGEPGTLRQNRWLRVACDKHQQEYLEWYDRRKRIIVENRGQGEAHTRTEPLRR